MARTAFVFSENGLLHDTGTGHPESPDRLRAIEAAFSRAGLDPPRVEPRLATRDDLLRVHSERHIAAIERMCASG
jgi:acetoin utilization deacetylase AcuC-like enzyme